VRKVLKKKEGDHTKKSEKNREMRKEADEKNAWDIDECPQGGGGCQL
jgi:hypothetical protein